MKIINYKNFFLEGKTPVSFSGNEITVDFKLDIKTHSIEDKLQIQHVTLTFLVSASQAGLLKTVYTDFPLAAGRVRFIAEPERLSHLEITPQTDNRELMENYRHILFDLTQYATWQHQHQVEV